MQRTAPFIRIHLAYLRPLVLDQQIHNWEEPTLHCNFQRTPIVLPCQVRVHSAIHLITESLLLCQKELDNLSVPSTAGGVETVPGLGSCGFKVEVDILQFLIFLHLFVEHFLATKQEILQLAPISNQIDQIVHHFLFANGLFANDFLLNHISSQSPA